MNVIPQPLQYDHDLIIEIASNQFDRSNYDVYTNPGSEKNAGIGDNYPDIILTDKGGRTVRFIIEVETDKTINDLEVSQWKKYSTEIKASLYILVPHNYKDRVVWLLSHNKIRARVGTYRVDIDKLVINYD